jgi:hypothetical protein
MKRVVLVFFLYVARLSASSPQVPTEDQVARCEPLIFFVLGMSAHKSAGTWEFFYPSESTAAAAYDRVAHFVSEKLGFVEAKNADAEWRARFVTFIDRYYSRYYSEWGDVGMILDYQRLFSDAKRSASLDAYLAGAYARFGDGARFQMMVPWKANSVAALLNRRIDTGVITHSYIGYSPGGTAIEFKETGVLRKIFKSWSSFADTPDDHLAGRVSGGTIVGEFVVVLKNHEIGKNTTEELPKALSYELDRSELGFIVSDGYSMEEIEVEIALFDEQRGLAAVRRILREYAVPASSTIKQTSPTARELPVYIKEEPNQPSEPTSGLAPSRGSS